MFFVLFFGVKLFWEKLTKENVSNPTVSSKIDQIDGFGKFGIGMKYESLISIIAPTETKYLINDSLINYRSMICRNFYLNLLRDAKIDSALFEFYKDELFSTILFIDSKKDEETVSLFKEQFGDFETIKNDSLEKFIWVGINNVIIVEKIKESNNENKLVLAVKNYELKKSMDQLIDHLMLYSENDREKIVDLMNDLKKFQFRDLRLNASFDSLKDHSSLVLNQNEFTREITTIQLNSTNLNFDEYKIGSIFLSFYRNKLWRIKLNFRESQNYEIFFAFFNAYPSVRIDERREVFFTEIIDFFYKGFFPETYRNNTTQIGTSYLYQNDSISVYLDKEIKKKNDKEENFFRYLELKNTKIEEEIKKLKKLDYYYH